MISFKDFFLFENSLSIHKVEGNHIYHHEIDGHAVQTHFYPRETQDGKKHFDMHFTHDGNFDRKGKTDSSHKIKAIHAVISHAKHFVSNEKPDSLSVSANTKKKREFSHKILSHMGKASHSQWFY